MEKIKLVFIQYRLVCGGAEQALFDLLNLLDKDKFDITVYAQYDDGEWNEKFWDAGIPVHFDYTCRKASWNPLVKIGNLIKKYQIEQCHKNQDAGLMDICCPDADILVSYSTWGRNEIGFGKKAKSVMYIHGDIATNPVFRNTMEGRREYLDQYDKFVCVSVGAKASLCQWLGRTEGIETHYNPLNSELVREKSMEAVDLPDDLPIICAVGRLAPEKAFERQILIHKNLLDQGIRHRLVLVGDGPDMEFLERLVRATGTGDTVIFAGYQDNPYPYMKASKFLVNSSYTEGLPVIAMEALSLGVPMVATAPSVAEAFGDQLCGIITENDTDSLQEGIKKMLTDEAFYAQAKAGAQERGKFFDGRRMVKEVEQMFLDLMKEE